MSGPYLNTPGYEIPDNHILTVPFVGRDKDDYKKTLESLKGKTKRDWFNSHFYYCLPIGIGNQYGFVVKSLRDFTMEWSGVENDVGDIDINFLNEDNQEKQSIHGGFSQGIVTVQNSFGLRTPENINLMTIQPPNMFLPGCVAMTGVIETDQIRRDFTFNIKITIPNFLITVKKGDPLGAFIPIPRNFVENFEIKSVLDVFDESIYKNELGEQSRLGEERTGIDKTKPHESGRRYYNGIHTDSSKYKNHQKRLV
jgi:hypothetical protein